MRALFASLFALLVASHANAMSFSLSQSGPASLEIMATGLIAPGDVQHLRDLVDQIPPGIAITGLRLSSLGGNVGEAQVLARAVRIAHLPVTVGPGGSCASACFLIFAAAQERHVAPSARIGVHSASINGQESSAAMAVTTVVAREAGAYGVPMEIVGKLVVTASTQMAWLNAGDLQAMGVLPVR